MYKADIAKDWLSVSALLKITTDADDAQELVQVVVKAVQLLTSQEILPEDLMSAVLEVLPPAPIHPLRQKLLLAQDFIEERQTLADNVEAGGLRDIDFDRVDLKNVDRIWAKTAPVISASNTVAAAFYLVAAGKDSYTRTIRLANQLQFQNPLLPPLVILLAQAYHQNQDLSEK